LGWTSAVHPDDSHRAGTTFIDANTRRITFHSLFRLRRRDGNYRWVSDNGLPRYNANGDYEGMVGTVIDVHEQKLAELALQRLTKKLRTSRDQAQALNVELQTSNTQLTRTNIDLDNFIYTASHDLKSPITNIEGLLLALDQQLPAASRDQEVTSMLEMMHESVVRFKRTINHLSDVVKLQKEHEQSPADVLLAPVIEDIRLDLMPLSLQIGAHLEVEVDPALSVPFSPKNLRSVIYNLVSNALKYSHLGRKPLVRIWSHEETEHVVLSVQDNGLGLDAGQQAELFTMFRRLHTHVEGTGIGLYMVKRSVENAGGKVQVTSELGAGSTFSVYFRR
jgi:signal transduction histidine kinase